MSYRKHIAGYLIPAFYFYNLIFVNPSWSARP